jgi:short-subunit dehydrogenase
MTVVITGASGGLGAALGEELARRGHAVGLIARRDDALAAVAERIRASGGRCATAVASVTDREALGAAVSSIEAELGPIDIAVANAGLGGVNATTRMHLGRATEMFRTNIDGVLNLADIVLPNMIARKSGQFAAVSSLAGWRGLPTTGPYCASKAAVTTLMDAWRIELRSYGVAITTIHPGFVKTPMTANDKNPMPFLLEPDDAARRMANGLLARRGRVDFPFPLAWIMRFAVALPSWIYEPVMARLAPVPKPR